MQGTSRGLSNGGLPVMQFSDLGVHSCPHEGWPAGQMATVALEDVQRGIDIPNSNLEVYLAYYAARIGETLAHH